VAAVVSDGLLILIYVVPGMTGILKLPVTADPVLGYDPKYVPLACELPISIETPLVDVNITAI
jgi:hypothetical protein